MGLQSDPIDLGLDGNGRAQFGVNVRITKEPSETVDEEIEAVLVAGGISAGSIFVHSKAVLPTDGGPYLSVILTGGVGIRTHNIATGFAYTQTTAQLVARGLVASAAKALAQEALAVLQAVKNTTVVP